MPNRLKQVEFIVKGCDVRRFHAVYTIQHQTVGEHSARVALLLRVLLQEDITTRVLYAALLHDLAEQITGDMPADIKHKLGLTQKMADMEEAELLLAGFDPPPLLTDIERKALKLADCLDGLIFCNREIELGNSAMLFIRERYLQYIDAMEGLPSDWRHLINSLRDRNP